MDTMTERETTPDHTVELPAELSERIEARLPETHFESVDAYAVTALDVLLRQVTRIEAGDTAAARSGTSEGGPVGRGVDEDTQSDQDSEAVEERLESLGYL